jgi:hypothetical protein
MSGDRGSVVNLPAVNVVAGHGHRVRMICSGPSAVTRFFSRFWAAAARKASGKADCARNALLLEELEILPGGPFASLSWISEIPMNPY